MTEQSKRFVRAVKAVSAITCSKQAIGDYPPMRHMARRLKTRETTLRSYLDGTKQIPRDGRVLRGGPAREQGQRGHRRQPEGGAEERGANDGRRLERRGGDVDGSGHTWSSSGHAGRFRSGSGCET